MKVEEVDKYIGKNVQVILKDNSKIEGKLFEGEYSYDGEYSRKGYHMLGVAWLYYNFCASYIKHITIIDEN